MPWKQEKGLQEQKFENPEILAQGFSRFQPWVCSPRESTLKAEKATDADCVELSVSISQYDNRLVTAHSNGSATTDFDSAALSAFRANFVGCLTQG